MKDATPEDVAQMRGEEDEEKSEINKLHSDPDFYCIFAGKINSIYEIEKVL